MNNSTENPEHSPPKKKRKSPTKRKLSRQDSFPRDNGSPTFDDGKPETANLETENESTVLRSEIESISEPKGSPNKKAACEKCTYCDCHNDNKEPKKRFDCKECRVGGIRRTFATLEKLEYHIREVHEETSSDLVFVCKDCSTPSVHTSKAKFLYHAAARHPGVINFVCDLCAAIFKLKANFKNHMSTHNIQVRKSFMCHVCSGTFVNKAGLDSHLRRFPGPHIKRVCAHCGFSFSKEQHMLNHRCKKLLIEEAALRAAEAEAEAAEALNSLDKVKVEVPQVEEESRMPPLYQQIPIAVEEPVVIQELNSTNETEQIIIRELSGQIVPNNHVLQFDVSDGVGPAQHVYHVNVADWSMVAPYVIRDPERAIQ